MLPKRIKNRIWCHITVVPDTLDAEAEVLVVPKGAEASMGNSENTGFERGGLKWDLN